MKFIISGKHIELTEAIKNYAQEKVAKIKKYDENINEVHIQIEVINTKSEGELQKVTSTVFLTGKTIRIEEENKDLYTAIDLMVDKLVRQIRKYKEKNCR